MRAHKYFHYGQRAIVVALATQLGGFGPSAHAQLQAQIKVQPKVLWSATYSGYFTGYETSTALRAAINAAQEAALARCIAYEQATPPYSCGKLVITSVIPDVGWPSTPPLKYNGVETYWYAQGDSYYHQVMYPEWTLYTGSTPAVPIGFTRSLECPKTDGFGPAVTSLGNREYKLECIKYETPPQQCTPGAKGKAAGSGAGGGVGNPISVIGGRKTEYHVDYVGGGGLLRLERRFRGQYQGWALPGQPELIDPNSSAPFSVQEPREFTTIDAATGAQVTYVKVLDFPVISSSTTGEVQRINADGSTVPYRTDANNTFPVGTDGDSLQKVDPPTVQGATWRWRRASDETDEYGPDGKPRRMYWPDGKSLVYAYNGTNLASITDNFGRQITTTVDPENRLTRFWLPDGTSIAYDYTGDLLTRATFADGASKAFIYAEPANTANAWLRAPLTGTVDENGLRIGTYKYDSSGRAFSSEGANGVGKFVLKDWGTNIEVTPPVGDPYRVFYGDANGAKVVLSRSQPAGAGCTASSSSLAYDASGNVTNVLDFSSRRTCYAYDLTRNIETVRVEGTGGVGCTGLTAAGSTLPAGSRKVNTQWHPDWRMESKVAEPGRMTTYVYNGQPDPFNANAIAGCAPVTALLPDGKPIAVLCRQVEQATTDANGSLGFSAALQAGVANREQKWTYNQYGQVLTHDGPRTDVVDITTYAYYTDTAFTGSGSAAVGHTIGDLQSVTNAAGKVTQYTKYDKHGQLLESVDPNGVVSSFSYDLRQRLLSSTTGGQTTTYTYDPAGQLKRITRPDASYVGYEYDSAHRQTAVFDNLGNRIEYTLDNAGNRTAENVKDTSGALRRQLARSIDALGRVQQTRGRE
ncbi:RHS repeat protein [Rhizobacter sp. AJA081-3]|uniref:RHS repeat protein n=1 Tax=Rhizobacter sp. AJA081-3 TaxID=2753607 RepID=UPI001AE01C85|nr:RHS repeat protein [Rhizobacter sp. AJA081-3]QTN25657.1 RHS repeat protein [Rhizobacter sp. AJA081-3]